MSEDVLKLPAGTVRFEPLIAEFTGTLITFQTKSGHKMGLKTGVPVEKGRGYMLRYNDVTGEGRLLPVVFA